MGVINIKNEKYHTEANAFLDGDLGFQRYDTLKNSKTIVKNPANKDF